MVLEDVEHAQARCEHLLGVVRLEVLDKGGGGIGALCFEEELEVALRRGLLELDVAAEEVEDRDRLASREKSGSGRAKLNLRGTLARSLKRCHGVQHTSCSTDNPNRAIARRTTRSGLIGRLEEQLRQDAQRWTSQPPT